MAGPHIDRLPLIIDSGLIRQFDSSKDYFTIGFAQYMIPYASASGSFSGSSSFQYDSFYLTVPSLKDTALTSGRITYAGANGVLKDSANLVFDGTYLIANSIKDSALTSGRVTYASSSGLLIDSANLTFDGTNLSISSHIALTLISSNTTYYIATGGSDTTGDGSFGSPWATVAHALLYLVNYCIAPGVTVTITVGDGTYTQSSLITITHPQGSQIKITGTNTYTTTVTSIASSSGSTGSWSYVLNVASVVNIAVNDYVSISGATGGTYPRNIQGCLKVTAVGASTITVASTFHSTVVASGGVTANITVFKTILSCASTGCFYIGNWQSLNLITKMILVGNGSSVGIKCDGGYTNTGVVGFNTWSIGVYSTNRAFLNAYGINAASACAVGFQCDSNSGLIANNSISTGNSSHGYYCTSSSMMDVTGSSAGGNSTTGFFCTFNAGIYATVAYADFNTNGFYALDRGFMNIGNSVAYYNSTFNVIIQQGSFARFDSGTSTNSIFGIYCVDGSVTTTYSASVSSNTTNYSPAVNTVGNNNSITAQ